MQNNTLEIKSSQPSTNTRANNTFFGRTPLRNAKLVIAQDKRFKRVSAEETAATKVLYKTSSPEPISIEELVFLGFEESQCIPQGQDLEGQFLMIIKEKAPAPRETPVQMTAPTPIPKHILKPHAKSGSSAVINNVSASGSAQVWAFSDGRSIITDMTVCGVHYDEIINEGKGYIDVTQGTTFTRYSGRESILDSNNGKLIIDNVVVADNDLRIIERRTVATKNAKKPTSIVPSAPSHELHKLVSVSKPTSKSVEPSNPSTTAPVMERVFTAAPAMSIFREGKRTTYTGTLGANAYLRRNLIIGGEKYQEVFAGGDGLVKLTTEDGVLTTYSGQKPKVDRKNDTLLIDGIPLKDCGSRILSTTQVDLGMR